MRLFHIVKKGVITGNHPRLAGIVFETFISRTEVVVHGFGLRCTHKCEDA